MRKTNIFFFVMLLLAACGQGKSKQPNTATGAASEAAIVETAKEACLFDLPFFPF